MFLGSILIIRDIFKMNKTVFAVVLVLVFLFGISWGVLPAGVFSNNSNRVTEVKIDSETQSYFETDQKLKLGAPIRKVEFGDLHVDVIKPNNNMTMFSFKDNNSKEQLILGCNSRLGDLSIAYKLDLLSGRRKTEVTDFAILHFKEGTDVVHESDLMRSPAFSTARGDNDIRSAMEFIKTLPAKDLIVFGVEKTNNDFETETIGWSKAYTVEQFIDAFNNLDFSNCSDVTLKEFPQML